MKYELYSVYEIVISPTLGIKVTSNYGHIGLKDLIGSLINWNYELNRKND